LKTAAGCHGLLLHAAIPVRPFQSFNFAIGVLRYLDGVDLLVFRPQEHAVSFHDDPLQRSFIASVNALVSFASEHGLGRRDVYAHALDQLPGSNFTARGSAR
jgi:hypothetical protein